MHSWEAAWEMSLHLHVLDVALERYCSVPLRNQLQQKSSDATFASAMALCLLAAGSLRVAASAFVAPVSLVVEQGLAVLATHLSLVLMLALARQMALPLRRQR